MRRFSFVPRRAAERPRGVGTALTLVVIYAGLAALTRVMSFHVNQFTMFWPANGAVVVALLILPPRACLSVVAACFGVNMTLNLLTNYPLLDSWVISSLNIFVSYLTAVLTRWLCGAVTDLSRLRRLAAFAPIVFLSAAVEAAIGEAMFPASPTLDGVTHDWLQWALCDGLGLLLSTPAILLSFKNYLDTDHAEAGPAERLGLAAAISVLTLTAFAFLKTPAFLLIFPLLILTAFRAGPAWVLASILVTALIASGLTAHGHGPFVSLSRGDTTRAQDLLQVFLVAIFLTAVPATNALGEKARSARRLLRLKSLLEHSATHDALTGLANRSLFKTRLNALLISGARCAVLFIDLDRFKQVNDTLGHAAGDELLRSFGTRLVDIAADATVVARFGGDEFAILLSAPLDQPSQERLCRRIAEAARMPFPLERGPALVSASVGLAVSPHGGVDMGELMRRADIALYSAKAARREGWRIYDGELDAPFRDTAAIEADLRAALNGDGEGQLQLHYQPKVGADQIVRGVEALLRWRHPTLGPIPVERVIAVAEDSGLIIPLGAWVLREALAFANRWPGLDVAINVSAAQLRDGDFIADVLAGYRAAPAAHGRLELEVTETALMDDIALVSVRLATLRAAGVRIALDDFGTGYSSLRHLHRCTVDRVKIDQSFVGGLDDGAEAAPIVRAIIQLGHAMGLQVTAEGVETLAQSRFLLQAGVDELQGFLFSRPLEEAALSAYLPVRAR